jgi:hypothetical protein
MFNRKKFLVQSIILSNIVSFLTLPCQAKDSLWLLCDNGKMALNLHEHRAGLGRAISFSLLFGGYTLTGDLINANQSIDQKTSEVTDYGKVVLRGNPKYPSNFKGEIAVNYTKEVVSLNGVLNLQGERFNIKYQLQCKELRSEL